MRKTSEAETDANFVMTGSGDIVEIQATAEKTPFSEDQFAALLALARKGIEKLVRLQKMAVCVRLPFVASTARDEQWPDN